ncbi:MAG: hypothetical protein LBR07_09710 [Puniceicoccales bacterium]|jgi:mono/diheme cytochrome c family protein|nr:hypothetical protein [Puniceicoccales bacterium]
MVSRVFLRLFGVVCAVIASVFYAAGGVAGGAPATALPVNLARTARVKASNVYSGDYAARFAVDGVVAGEECGDDLRQAWAVNGARGRAADFTLEWDAPQTVAEVVYFGRTGMVVEECFRDYELFVNDEKTPVASGTFAAVHGAQRAALPAARRDVRKLVLRFKNAHTKRHNPGASEIAVFAESPAGAALEKMFAGNVPRNAAAQALADALASQKYGFEKMLVVKRQHLRISHVYTYHVEGFAPGGGLFVFSPKKALASSLAPSKNTAAGTAGATSGALEKIFDAGAGMVVDADLHWNGEDVVFSYKKKGRFIGYAASYLHDLSYSQNPDENYQIYTMKIDGSNLRQLTNAPCNNLNACWLPDGGIAFISDRKPAYAYCFTVTSPVLYRMERDGSKQRRLSANYLMDFTPSVLNDGRIIFTRWEYVDRCACPIQSLWAINPDGTGLSGYFGNRILEPGTFMDARAIPNSPRIFSTATNHNGPCRGAIVRIDKNVGPNAVEGVLNATREVRIFDRRRGSWKDVWGNGISGPYEKPFPLDEDVFLVSKNGDLQIRDTAGAHLTLLRSEKQTKLGFYSAHPIRKYPVPPVVRANSFNPHIKLPEDGSVSGGWATIAMQDVYNGLLPAVKRGEVKKIAVVQELEKPTFSPHQRKQRGNAGLSRAGGGQEEIGCFGYQFPLVSCGATYAAKRVWGYADVNADGSACFQVPSEVPVYFLALDADGRAVQRMRTFTHLMPGEVQSCIGCHADRNTVTPARDISKRRNLIAQKLQKPSWGVKGFSYHEIVQPVLDKNCVSCHSPVQKNGGVDLSGERTDFFNVSYEHLARKGTQGEWKWRLHHTPVDEKKEGANPYTSWIWTINGAEWNTLEIAPKRWGSPASKLAEIIAGGHLDKNGKKRVALTADERLRIYQWIDLNVPYYPTSGSNHPSEIGCRRQYPETLDATLADVAKRRCAECHTTGVPREFYTRFEKPELNSFLLAPLSRDAGGAQRCSRPVFRSKSDPDYQRILREFAPIRQRLKTRPRADMPEFQNAQTCAL